MPFCTGYYSTVTNEVSSQCEILTKEEHPLVNAGTNNVETKGITVNGQCIKGDKDTNEKKIPGTYYTLLMQLTT